MPKMKSKLISLGTSALAFATLAAAGPTQNGNKTVIIQMFEWNWESIAAECTAFIGPAGYGFVQASPAQEHITGDEWWTDYQPVSYNLVSKRGDQAQYAAMISTCEAAGVKIIADTVWNHVTSGDGSGTGTDGSSYTKYSYPAVPYSDDGDFHHCGSPDGEIDNYDNATQVWTCELDGLADLATDTSENVRSKEAAYGNTLISLGVAGFRLDAAKSINPNDIANITSRLNSDIYITQEVIWGADNAVEPSMYTGNGDVMEFRYTSALQTAFLSGGINALENLDDEGWVPSSNANVFVADHDTERSGSSLNYSSPDNTYTMAHVFSLAHPYGTPTVLSSYTYSTYDQGGPNNYYGTCTGNTGENGWLCQHRWLPISGMVGFRNNVGSASLVDWVSPSSQQIAFGRGSLGFVAINNEDSTWSNTFTTSLPAGTYCDVLSGNVSSSGACTGNAVTVSSTGTFTADVPSYSGIAIHTGAKGTSASTVSVYFEEYAETTYGQNIYITGSISELGDWTPADGVALSSADYPTWTATIDLPASTTFQYKFVKIEGSTVTWESDPNRNATTPASGSVTISDTWR